MIELLIQINVRPASSEKYLNRLFNGGVWARIPLRDKIKFIKVPICFMYGEYDFIRRDVADFLKERGDLKIGS